MTYKVDKGIPVPDIKRGRPNKFPWTSLQIGDSFIMDCGTNAARNKATKAGYRYKMKFATRKETETTTRIWRVK